MKRFDPFHKVNCKYGAPMGRRGANTVVYSDNGKLCARHCGGYDAYDKGGAYWGSPLNIWAVWNHGKGDDTVTYVRADNRSTALVFAQTEGEV